MGKRKWKNRTIIAFIRRYRTHILLSLLGACAGIIYWKFWGCENGCPIKSNWYAMMGYGGILGWISGGLIEDIKRKKDH
jgi:hypothetical protein